MIGSQKIKEGDTNCVKLNVYQLSITSTSAFLGL